MIKFQNILILFLIAVSAILFVFQKEIGDFLNLYYRPTNFYSSIKPVPLVNGLFVGDIMLSRGVAYQIEKNNDLELPFQNIKNLLLKNDFVFGNLEAPIIDGRKIKGGEMILRVDEKMVPVLKKFNFSVLSLANNHLLDFGAEGLIKTIDLLKIFDIYYVGAEKNESEAYDFKIIEKNGIKFAFLAQNDTDVIPSNNCAQENKNGTACFNLEKLKEKIKEAKQLANYVIVSLHAGNEYQYQPNENQIKFTHAAIDAGADLIIGHHPHVIQPIEKYRNGYIFYSLGNFVFDQMWSHETREAIAVRIIFSPSAIKTIQIYPILIENYSQPKIINSFNEPEHFKNIISKLNFPDNKFVLIQQ
ncbi:MAG: CapA family protein [Patescibacteria group bacterium]|nr:CapA family protein [Patescibacteria group bacterium]